MDFIEFRLDKKQDALDKNRKAGLFITWLNEKFYTSPIAKKVDVDCVVKNVDENSYILRISTKDNNDEPLDGFMIRFPVFVKSFGELKSNYGGVTSAVCSGSKLNRGVLKTDLYTYIVGYIGKDYVDKLGKKNIEARLAYDVDDERIQNRFNRYTNSHFLVNQSAFIIVDGKEYYPVTMHCPDVAYAKGTSKKVQLRIASYIKEVEHGYSIFQIISGFHFGSFEKAQKECLIADISGNVAKLRKGKVAYENLQKCKCDYVVVQNGCNDERYSEKEETCGMEH